MSSNRNEQVSVPFRILSDGPERGQSILFIGAFAPGKSTDITCDALENAGWNGDLSTLRDLNGLGDVDCEIVVVHEVREGKRYPRIRFVNALGGGFKFKQELDDRAIVSLAARLAKQRTKSGGAAPPPDDENGWNGTGPDPGDDDIPF
jgi:hypothetical protein